MSLSPQGVAHGTVVLRIDPSVRYRPDEEGGHLELLKAAANASLDMIALTDIGTISGFEALQRDLEKLLLLEKAGILSPSDEQRLNTHRDLRTRTQLLPGFTVTSSEGLRLSGIFAPDSTPSSITTILQHLGASSTDGLCHETAPRVCALIEAIGGVVVAHPSTSEHAAIVQTLVQTGVLHAISQPHDEVENVCILGGSDATTLDDIGSSFSEVTLTSASFSALRDVIKHNHTRLITYINTPIRRWAMHQLLQATNDDHIVHLADAKSADITLHVAALANIEGGVLIIGSENGTIVGVKQSEKVIATVQKAIEQITPTPAVTSESVAIDNDSVVRVEVRASEPPYVLRDGRVMIRREAQSVAATPNEIKSLCITALNNGADLDLPRSGVSVVSAQRRAGIWHYEVRDLRTTAGVTYERAQGLWRYAIEQFEKLREGQENLDTIKWQGQIGLWRTYEQGGRPKYDLVHRDRHGTIDHIFYGVSDWGLGLQWQQLINTYAPQLTVGSVTFDDEQGAAMPATSASHMATSPMQTMQFASFQGERRPRWRGRGAITRIWRDEQNKPRFDLLLKNKTNPEQEGNDSFEIQEYHGVTRDQLNQAWLDLILVKKPRTGIEVVETVQDDQGDRRFIFRNLRNDEVSPHPWRMNDIEEGSIRQYSAPMHLADQAINEEQIRWWGNIGYMRPMRRQVDLIYRDEEGVDHIFYAARRDELQGEWNDLMVEYDDVVD
ncbi:MAG: helix-turn-helix domain-containing protein [Roseiflexaceae bacterium]